MKVVVTGASGYIGRHVVSKLIDDGCDVLAIDVVNNGVDERAEFYSASIFEYSDELSEKMRGADACIHMAWRNGFVHNADSHIEELYSHYKFLKNVMESGIGQVAVMGTMHEIGYWEGAIDENTPAKPISKYGIAKNALRQLFTEEVKAKDLILQWIRCYYITGDDLKNNSIFAKLVKAEEEGQATFPFTSGKNKYDFIDVDELASQISCVIRQKEVQGIINCCSGNPISLADKVESFIKENNFNIKLEYGKFPDRPYDSPGVWGDNTKIELIKHKYNN